MPPIVPAASLYFLQRFAELQRNVGALQTQQQSTITDGQGRPILNIGLIPGSNPATYGLQFLDPVSTQPRMLIGSNGTEALIEFYDTAGNVVLSIDASGLSLLSDLGVVEAFLGNLDTSPEIYGLAVLNDNSVMQQVSGLVSSPGGATASISTSSTTAVPITNTSVSAVIGESGQALVTISGWVTIATTTLAAGAYVAVRVDGVISGSDWLVNFITALNTTSEISCSFTQLLTGLPPGPHTFDAAASVSDGSATGGGFQVQVVVQPF